MKSLLFFLWFTLNHVFAATIPPATMVTSTPQVTGTTKPTTIEQTESVPVVNTEPTHTELLRQDLGGSPFGYRHQGRVILATTHVDGSDDWGVTAAQAEVSCERIARMQAEAILPDELQKLTVQRKPKLEGHLLSVGTSYEVMALSRLLHPLPNGAFWTGGKLTRYRVSSMRDKSHTDHIILTWTDGRTGRPSVLGMTKNDQLQLQDGYTYCLALNLHESTWQARDCSDQLPYACLITPRRIRFSNQAQGSETVKPVPSTSTVTQRPTTANGGVETTTETLQTEEVSNEDESVMTTTASLETAASTEASEDTQDESSNLLREAGGQVPVTTTVSSDQTLTATNKMMSAALLAERHEGKVAVDATHSTESAATESSTATPSTTQNLLKEAIATEQIPTSTSEFPAVETTVASMMERDNTSRDIDVDEDDENEDENTEETD